MDNCKVEDSGANDTVTYFDTNGDRVDVFLNSTTEYGYLHNMWKKSTGDCQSVITKDDDNEDIVITKSGFQKIVDDFSTNKQVIFFANKIKPLLKDFKSVKIVKRTVNYLIEQITNKFRHKKPPKVRRKKARLSL